VVAAREAHIVTALYSEYMEWAKTRSHARFNLASSGLLAPSLDELGAGPEQLEVDGPGGYGGYRPLIERLARKAGVAEDRVLHAAGASMANFLVLAASASAGDEVLIEEPTYTLLTDAARWLRLEIRRFPRAAEDGFALRAREVERALTARTRLVVVTNLHNPSSALAAEDELRETGEMARSVGARVMVDEVYRESLLVLGRPSASAARLGPHFVVTSSLTKAYGLSGLRCGWAVGDPDLVRRMWRLNDLFGVVPVHPGERLSVLALDRLESLAARSRAILERNRAAVNAFLDRRPDLSCPKVDAGMIAFPRLLRGDVDGLCESLRSRYETTVVPGRFFGAPQHFRVALGGAPDVLEGGLERLGRALDERGPA
jgi:aspartate/methionine/tyrosine aminotransferase